MGVFDWRAKPVKLGLNWAEVPGQDYKRSDFVSMLIRGFIWSTTTTPGPHDAHSLHPRWVHKHINTYQNDDDSIKFNQSHSIQPLQGRTDGCLFVVLSSVRSEQLHLHNMARIGHHHHNHRALIGIWLMTMTAAITPRIHSAVIGLRWTNKQTHSAQPFIIWAAATAEHWSMDRGAIKLRPNQQKYPTKSRGNKSVEPTIPVMRGRRYWKGRRAI